MKVFPLLSANHIMFKKEKSAFTDMDILDFFPLLNSESRNFINGKFWRGLGFPKPLWTVTF